MIFLSFKILLPISAEEISRNFLNNYKLKTTVEDAQGYKLKTTLQDTNITIIIFRKFSPRKRRRRKI